MTNLKVSYDLKKSKVFHVWYLPNHKKMKLPNWQHHSKKEQKRKLKPQALRQAKARRQALKKRLQGDASFL